MLLGGFTVENSYPWKRVSLEGFLSASYLSTGACIIIIIIIIIIINTMTD
jgi:hypothetical protein